MSDPFVTPAHIVPEWYFIFAYAILRLVPRKLGGVVGLLMCFVVLLLVPYWSKSAYMGKTFYPFLKLLFCILVLSFVILSYVGSIPVSEPYIVMTLAFSTGYFSYFVFTRPFGLIIEYVAGISKHPIITYMERRGWLRVLEDTPQQFKDIAEAKIEAWKSSLYEQTKKNVDEILTVLNEKDITDQINAIDEQLNATLVEAESEI